ncbi:MAG: tetratricopeptide repeat protein, partial [Anaerolineae bacterium]|nr:tetratricopeptide repeat protein [Anaerolineae bacterium]
MVEPLFRLAKAWSLKGNLAAAVAGFERALQLDPTYAPAYLELGGLRLRQGRVQDALDHYAQALALQPDDATTRLRYQYVKQMIEGGRQSLRPADAPYVALGAPLQDNP